MFNYLVILFIILIIIGLFFGWQMKSNQVAEPKYKVIKTDDNIEIREYPALRVAQVDVEGERYTAINTGFKMLADYIFGNNQTTQKIAMTAPVIQQGINLPMTAPVVQQKIGNTWQIRFVMPAEFTLATLPKPNNPAITLLEIPTKKYVVIRFAGANTQTNLDPQEEILLHYIRKHMLEKVGAPVYAFYNPPWILPFLRRNEIMIEIN